MDTNEPTKPEEQHQATVTIYGASDDLIEIEGEIREEFTPLGDGDETFMAFSDGTVLSIEYMNSGIWRIHLVRKGSAHYDKTEGTDPEGDYSDRVTLTGDIRWVVAGAFAKTKKEAR